MCPFPCFGLPDVVQRLFRLGVGGFRQAVEDIHGLVHPTPLLSGGGEYFLKRRPEAHGAVSDGQFRRIHAAGPELQQDLASH